MIQTFEAVIDEHGKVQPVQDAVLPKGKRALVTILDEFPMQAVPETAILSEMALTEDWARPEEDEAWSYRQPEHSSL